MGACSDATSGAPLTLPLPPAALLSDEVIDLVHGEAWRAALFKGCTFHSRSACAQVLPTSRPELSLGDEGQTIREGFPDLFGDEPPRVRTGGVSLARPGGAASLRRHRSHRVAKLRRAPPPSGLLNAANDDTQMEALVAQTAQLCWALQGDCSTRSRRTPVGVLAATHEPRVVSCELHLARSIRALSPDQGGAQCPD